MSSFSDFKNSKIIKAWKYILTQSFEKFLGILSDEEIKERINYIIDIYIIQKGDPVKLYKNLLFMSFLTPISELTLDYNISLITEYKKIVNDPTSVEIEKINDKDLNNLISKYLVLLNIYTDNYIYCGENNININSKIKDFFSIPTIYFYENSWFSFFDENEIQIRYFCSLPELIYAAVYGIFPKSGKKISVETQNNIKKMYPERYLCMEAFKHKYPEGILENNKQLLIS
jgi:hypothetical protein